MAGRGKRDETLTAQEICEVNASMIEGDPADPCDCGCGESLLDHYAGNAASTIQEAGLVMTGIWDEVEFLARREGEGYA